MDNYLTLLYYERFKISEKEKSLMDNNTWENSENGRISRNRNDQSITDVRQQIKMIDKFIEKYIEKIKQ